MSKALVNKVKLNDVVSVKDFGAVGDGVADDTSSIQAALDAASLVFLPEGIYKTTAVLKMNDGNFIQGSGRGYGSETGTQITATHNGPVFKGKDVTPSSGTNVRRFNGGGANFWIYGPGVSAGSSIGLDMRGCSMFKWNNIRIQNINTGVATGSNYSSYYNEFYGCDMDTVSYGYYQTTLGNENLVVGGRVNNCTVGTYDSDNSHNKYIGLAIEAFTGTGHKTDTPVCQYITYIASRVENQSLVGTAFSIHSTSQETLIDWPVIISVATSGLPSAGTSPNGTKTTVRWGDCYAESGKSARKSIRRIVVNQAISSLASGATRQDTFTLSGVAAGDSVKVTLPYTWPSGLNCSPVIVGPGLGFLQLHNPTGGAISMSTADFVFEVTQYT